jgi:hypothetical protein
MAALLPLINDASESETEYRAGCLPVFQPASADCPVNSIGIAGQGSCLGQLED